MNISLMGVIVSSSPCRTHKWSLPLPPHLGLKDCNCDWLHCLVWACTSDLATTWPPAAASAEYGVAAKDKTKDRAKHQNTAPVTSPYLLLWQPSETFLSPSKTFLIYLNVACLALQSDKYIHISTYLQSYSKASFYKLLQHQMSCKHAHTDQEN